MISCSKYSNVTIKWKLIPLHQEKADWLTLYYQANENHIIRPIWDDINGVTKFGTQKFNDALSINVVKSTQVTLKIQKIEETMTIYLTVVFINKKGEIQGGPMYSKTKIVVFGKIIVHFPLFNSSAHQECKFVQAMKRIE